MSEVSIQHLTKHFTSQDERVVAVDDLTIEVEQGEMFTLLGPSGCGKTTTLRCLAGLETFDSGRIEIHGEVVADGEGHFVPPERRDIGLMFQSYALWPHMTVRENILYPLKARDFPKERRDDKIREILDLVDLPDVGNRYPGQLSGGQQQRVALARALSYEPSVLLMDEPLSNLDFQLRRSMRRKLIDILDDIGITTIYVTHDQEEAFELSDRIAILRDGKLVQIGEPTELYRRPKAAFAADFLGEANLFEVERMEPVEGHDGLIACTVYEGDEPITIHGVDRTEGMSDHPVLVTRPEHLDLEPVGGGSDGTAEADHVTGRLVQQLYRGSFTQNIVEAGDLVFKVKTEEPRFEEGSAVDVVVPWASTYVVKE